MEEKQNHELAKRRLREAQEKVETVRRWTFKVRHEVDEYRGRIGQLQQSLDGDLPRMLALLDRMIAALESYVGIRGPQTGAQPAEDIPSAAPSGVDGLTPGPDEGA